MTACQLGGQLQSTKFAGSLTELNDIQKQDALKSEMGINFSAQYASGSFNYGKQRQAGEHRQSGRELDISRLAWTARGGNSLLCAKYVKLRYCQLLLTRRQSTWLGPQCR